MHAISGTFPSIVGSGAYLGILTHVSRFQNIDKYWRISTRVSANSSILRAGVYCNHIWKLFTVSKRPEYVPNIFENYLPHLKEVEHIVIIFQNHIPYSKPTTTLPPRSKTTHNVWTCVWGLKSVSCLLENINATLLNTVNHRGQATLNNLNVITRHDQKSESNCVPGFHSAATRSSGLVM